MAKKIEKLAKFSLFFVTAEIHKIYFSELKNPNGKNLDLRVKPHFAEKRFSQEITNLSQSVPTGYVPPDNPKGFAKICLVSQDSIIESCPGPGI